MKDDERKDFTCINGGERRCIKYDKMVFTLEIIRTIFTPKMILTMGFVIMMIMSMKGGG